MRAAFIVLGILLFLGSAVSGCGLVFFRLSMFEIPHPMSGGAFKVGPPGSSPREKTQVLGDGEYHVWIVLKPAQDVGPTTAATCQLVGYRSGDGTKVGSDSGTSCSFTAQARRGEVWEIEASASTSGAEGYVGEYNPPFPSPFWQILLSFVAGTIAGMVLFVVGLVRRRPALRPHQLDAPTQ